MNFKLLYEKYRDTKIGCDVIKNFKINRVMFGQGGSNNLILELVSKDSVPLIAKIIPSFVYSNVKVKPDYSELEIKFYQFLTKKYLLTNRTCHIVGIYNRQICPRLDKFLNTIKPSKKPCPSYDDRLTKKLNIDMASEKICDLLLRHEMKLIDSTFDIILLEHCMDEFGNMIGFYMDKIKILGGSVLKSVTNQFIENLSRILFQIIFTLAIIKEDYPGFLHGDLFIRNILLSLEEHPEEEYVAYHYKQKIFYLPANGIYAKINDFGMTLLANEILPSTWNHDKNFLNYLHKNPFNAKSDIFNLLHDIYDGQNLGTRSINQFANDLQISAAKIKPIKNFLSKFLKINSIDKMNKINRNLLNGTWDIDQIKVLESTVQTPDQYLRKNYFAKYQNLPKGATVINHFNRP